MTKKVNPVTFIEKLLVRNIVNPLFYNFYGKIVDKKNSKTLFSNCIEKLLVRKIVNHLFYKFYGKIVDKKNSKFVIF